MADHESVQTVSYDTACVLAMQKDISSQWYSGDMLLRDPCVHMCICMASLGPCQ